MREIAKNKVRNSNLPWDLFAVFIGHLLALLFGQMLAHGMRNLLAHLRKKYYSAVVYYKSK